MYLQAKWGKMNQSYLKATIIDCISKTNAWSPPLVALCKYLFGYINNPSKQILIRSMLDNECDANKMGPTLDEG